MPFEHYTEPLLSPSQWLRRIVRSLWFVLIIVSVALWIGVMGYHELGGLGWVDSILEASMILGGMGPVATMSNDTVKLFASAYALFSGFVMLSSVAILLAPWVHRLLHRFYGAQPPHKDKSNH